MIALPKPPSPINPVDLAEAGRVMATLDDWRALMLVQLIVIGILIGALLLLIGFIVRMANKRSANDQATLTSLQANTAAMVDHAASIRAMEVILSRWESEHGL